MGLATTGYTRGTATSIRNRYRRGGLPALRLGALTNLAVGAVKKLKSKTQTKLQNKKPPRRKQFRKLTINNPGGGITKSHYGASNPYTAGAYIRKKASLPNFLMQNAPGQFDALCGFQAVYWQALQNRSLFLDCYNQIPVAQPTGNYTRGLFLESVYLDQMFTNASNATAVMDIYDIVTKQDNDIVSPRDAWVNGLVQQMGLNPASPTYVDPSTYLGSLPTQSQQFNQFFKVVAKTSISLAAGASHRHTVVLKQRQLMKEARIRENVNYRGITYFTMAIVKGVPVSSKTETEPEIREVSSAPIGIDTVKQISSKFRWTQDIDSDVMVINQMQTLVDTEVMNTFGSVPVPVGRTNP